MHLILPNLTNLNLLFCLCLFHRFSPQSHSGGSSNLRLGKTSFVQKGRSMFPKVLLQWCAAISSCATEIGKPLKGSTTFVCLLCQKATCAVRLGCYNTKPCHWTVVVVWPALLQSRRRHQAILSCWPVLLRRSFVLCHRHTMIMLYPCQRHFSACVEHMAAPRASLIPSLAAA